MKLRQNPRIFYVLAAMMLLVGCQSETIDYSISASMPCEIESGSTKSFSLSGMIPPEAKISWEATEPGTFANPSSVSTNFTAPSVTQDTPLSITATVTGQRGQAVQTINCTILASEVTPTPESSPTPEPPTLIEEPAIDIQETTGPCPLLEIFPQAGGCIPFDFYSNVDIKSDLLTAEFVEDPVCIHSGEFGLKLVNTTGGTGEFAGWGSGWGTTGFDASGYANLSFWVTGMEGGEKFEFGLKDTLQNEIKIQSTIMIPHLDQGTWKQVVIDLPAFTGVNMTTLENFSIAFNDANDHESGTICVDDIAFIE